MMIFVFFLLSKFFISIETLPSKQGFGALNIIKDQKLVYELLSNALNDKEFKIKDCSGAEIRFDARKIKITDTGRAKIEENRWISKLWDDREFLVGDFEEENRRQYAFSIKRNYFDLKFQTPNIVAFNCSGNESLSLKNQLILRIVESKNQKIEFSKNYKFEDCQGNISNRTEDFEHDFKLKNLVTFYEEVGASSEVGNISPIGYKYVQYAGTSLDGKRNLQFEGYEEGTMLRGREYPCPV